MIWLFISSGVLLYLASPPLGLSPIAFIAIVPLIHAATKSPTSGKAALGGLLAGLAFFLPGVFWLTSVTYLGWAALALYCATYLAVFAIVTRAAGPRVLTLAATWILLEFFRGAIAFTGFPWLLLSHTQYNFILFPQVADLIGSYALGGILIAINVLLYRRQFPAVLAILAAVCLYGSIRMQTLELKPLLRTAMVQASIPQEMKLRLEGTYDPKGVLSRYLDASKDIPNNERIDLLVWPETVVLSPYVLNVRPELLNEPHATESRYVQDALRDLAVEHNAHFLVGAFSPLPPDYGYVITPGVATRIPAESWKLRYNSGYLLDPSGQYVDRYDKIHLVPFGEYIPLPHIFPFLAKLVPFDASLTAGDRRTIFNVNGSKFGVLICYEDTDSEMARRLRRDGADFLVNISNDAWFGSSELDQHFVPARFRAIENRVGVIRSGNNGITGVIDPLGRVGPVLPKNGIAAIVDTVETTGSRTLYSRIGDWPGVLAALAVVVVQALRRFPK